MILANIRKSSRPSFSFSLLRRASLRSITQARRDARISSIPTVHFQRTLINAGRGRLDKVGRYFRLTGDGNLRDLPIVMLEDRRDRRRKIPGRYSQYRSVGVSIAGELSVELSRELSNPASELKISLPSTQAFRSREILHDDAVAIEMNSRNFARSSRRFSVERLASIFGRRYLRGSAGPHRGPRLLARANIRRHNCLGRVRVSSAAFARWSPNSPAARRCRCSPPDRRKKSREGSLRAGYPFARARAGDHRRAQLARRPLRV